VPGAEGPRESQDDGATSGAPAPAPDGTSPGVPATQPTATAVPLWKQPAVLAAGATALVATGVTVYALTRDSASQRLEAELERQAGEARSNEPQHLDRLGTALGVTGVAGGALFLSRRASAAALPTPQDPGIVPGPGPAPKIDLPPLPTAADVTGDLSRNWGETPFDLRPLFLLIEEISRIFGAARYLAIVAKRESAFRHHRAQRQRGERAGRARRFAAPTPTTRTATRRCDTASRRPTSAAAACSGCSRPYFLWTGVPEVGAKAPLLNAPPEIVFQPRAAAFGAAVYMQRS
jgi:hypothetical protein